MWNCGSGGNTVHLNRPTVEDIQHVIAVLKQEKIINNVGHNEIDLWNSPTQSTVSLLSQLNQTAVSRLWIYYTTLTEQCGLQYLNNTDITVLGLSYCTIADIKCICQLIETNATLTVLSLYIDELTYNEILDSLTINKTIQSLILPSQYETKCTQHKNYQQLQHKLKYDWD